MIIKLIANDDAGYYQQHVTTNDVAIVNQLHAKSEWWLRTIVNHEPII